jgi:hypothetical protein
MNDTESKLFSRLSFCPVFGVLSKAQTRASHKGRFPEYGQFTELSILVKQGWFIFCVWETQIKGRPRLRLEWRLRSM